MIDSMGKIMHSTVGNLADSVGFLLIVIFYEISVLQLPIPEIFHMLGIVVIFSIGLNTILSSHQTARTSARL
jgi:hypothetical protein